ncbi:MAG: ankyrin repeat domain-containing protein, partial [Pseudomonadota bacterium]
MNRLADLISIEPAPSETIISLGEYQREPDSINIALIPEGLRALIASQFQASVNPPEASLVRRILQIDDRNIVLAQALRERIFHKKFVAYEEFKNFRTELGFQFSDLSKLAFESKAQIIFGWENIDFKDDTAFNLLKDSVLSYIKDNCYKSFFTAAIYNIPKLILALKGEINVDEMNIDGKTALHLAVEYDHSDVIEALVTVGANVQAKNHFGKTALHLAAQEGYIKAVSALLKAKDVDIQVKDDNSQSALYWAAKEGHVKVVKILLSAGAQVNVKNNRDEKTELHWAVQGGYVEIVEALLEAGADVGAKDDMSQTVLHLAAKGGYREIVEMLLKAGAPLQVKNKSGATALIEAVREGHSGVVDALL